MSTTPLNVPIPSMQALAKNAARLLQESLAQAAQASAGSQLTPVDMELARSNIKALAVVQGAGLFGAYAYLRDFVARQAVPIKSTDKFLDDWLDTYGMKRKEPAAAEGSATGTGVPGETLPAGTLLQADGRQYKVSTDTVVAGDGALHPTLIAVVAGATGNLGPGSVLTLLSPVAGIDADFTAGLDGLQGGVDLEKDAEAVYRLQQRLSNEPMGGAPGDYARWALEVPGITRAFGVRNPAGPTSAGVILMADGNAPYGLPTLAQRNAVYDYIRDPRRGPPDELFCIIPAAVPLNPTLDLTPDTPALRQAVTDALADLYFRSAVPGGSIPHNHLIEAVSAVAGEYNHTWTAPALTPGDLLTVAGFSELLVLGAVAFV